MLGGPSQAQDVGRNPTPVSAPLLNVVRIGVEPRALDVLGGIDEPLRARPKIDAGGSKRFPASSLPPSRVNSRFATCAANIRMAPGSRTKRTSARVLLAASHPPRGTTTPTLGIPLLAALLLAGLFVGTTLLEGFQHAFSCNKALELTHGGLDTAIANFDL